MTLSYSLIKQFLIIDITNNSLTFQNIEDYIQNYYKLLKKEDNNSLHNYYKLKVKQFKTMQEILKL